MSMNAILEVTGLSKQYKNSDFQLNDISFSLPSGSIMGFIGENGAGKSTTIGCILGTLIKDRGNVRIFGREMSEESSDIRDDIGVVLDANNYSDDLTANMLSVVMRHIYSKWDTTLFNEYLDRFKLPAAKKIKRFSRGMTMKLGLAVALSHHPKLLILDEATSGLDPIVREEMLDVFMGFVQDENNSILLSSHITTDLEKVADYIMFIHNGSIILNEKKHVLSDSYGVMRLKAAQFAQIDREDLLSFRKHDYQIDVLVADRKAAAKKYPGCVIDRVSIEEIMLMLVKGEVNG